MLKKILIYFTIGFFLGSTSLFFVQRRIYGNERSRATTELENTISDFENTIRLQDDIISRLGDSLTESKRLSGERQRNLESRESELFEYENTLQQLTSGAGTEQGAFIEFERLFREIESRDWDSGDENKE